jgi:hypothetical protein
MQFTLISLLISDFGLVSQKRLKKKKNHLKKTQRLVTHLLMVLV